MNLVDIVRIIMDDSDRTSFVVLLEILYFQGM